jgi:hypothetical protein
MHTAVVQMRGRLADLGGKVNVAPPRDKSAVGESVVCDLADLRERMTT